MSVAGSEQPFAAPRLNDRSAGYAGIEFSDPPSHGLDVIYVLAYPVFEPSCAKRINDFRAVHEPQRATLVRPHVTLVYGLPDEHIAAVSELIETTSRTTGEISVSFDDSAVAFDPFEKTYKIFLLCGAGGSELTALHAHLYRGEHGVELNSEQPFQPHMTIATYDKRADIEKVDIRNVGGLPLIGTIRALELVQVTDGRLTTLKSVPLLG